VALLDGKKIIVTGSSRGIGAGIVRLLASEGAQVAVTYSSSEGPAREVLASLKGEGHLIVPLQVADENSVQSAFAKVLEKFGELHGLVNNAGITKDQLLLRMKEEDFQSVIDINLKGTFFCTKLAVKTMMKARKGSIVNITSVIGQSGNAGQANYAASKAGVEGFTKSIAQEVGSRQVRVNCVAPGFIVTDMTEQLTEDQKKAILSKVPLESLGQTEDVAHAVAFLLSDKARYITGHTLSVNGGLYM
jgi:3-oxoacyl-[acyl-carrier protein] reductase